MFQYLKNCGDLSETASVGTFETYSTAETIVPLVHSHENWTFTESGPCLSINCVNSDRKSTGT